MEIKVLGSGCANCKRLLEHVEKAVEELNLKATITYVTDLVEIAKSGLMRTPGLIIDGKIVSSGKVLSINEIETLFKNSSNG